MRLLATNARSPCASHRRPYPSALFSASGQSRWLIVLSRFASLAKHLLSIRFGAGISLVELVCLLACLIHHSQVFQRYTSDATHLRRTTLISATIPTRDNNLCPVVAVERAVATCGVQVGALESPTTGRLTLSVPHQDAQPSFACNTTWPGVF